MQLNFVAFTNIATFAQEIWETRIKDADQKVSCLPGLSSHGEAEYFHKKSTQEHIHHNQGFFRACLFERRIVQAGQRVIATLGASIFLATLACVPQIPGPTNTFVAAACFERPAASSLYRTRFLHGGHSLQSNEHKVFSFNFFFCQNINIISQFELVSKFGPPMKFFKSFPKNCNTFWSLSSDCLFKLKSIIIQHSMYSLSQQSTCGQQVKVRPSVFQTHPKTNLWVTSVKLE